MMNNIKIRKTTSKDLDKILEVELAAFNGSKKVKNLLTDLLEDPTAAPHVSLLAVDGPKPVGHILFTRAKIRPRPGFCNLKSNAYILGPVGVIPNYRLRGVGKELLRKGLLELEEMGIARCFTLARGNFKPDFGFHPNAGIAGWPAPFPLSEEDQNAWMWLDLAHETDNEKGKVIGANAIMRPMYWKSGKRE